MKRYNLASLVHKDHVVVEIRKGMYGLPQAIIISNKNLVNHLTTSGYHQAKHTPGMFTNEWRPITFCLVVDDFGIKYKGK